MIKGENTASECRVAAREKKGALAGERTAIGMKWLGKQGTGTGTTRTTGTGAVRWRRSFRAGYTAARCVGRWRADAAILRALIMPGDVRSFCVRENAARGHCIV